MTSETDAESRDYRARWGSVGAQVGPPGPQVIKKYVDEIEALKKERDAATELAAHTALRLGELIDRIPENLRKRVLLSSLQSPAA